MGQYFLSSATLIKQKKNSQPTNKLKAIYLFTTRHIPSTEVDSDSCFQSVNVVMKTEFGTATLPTPYRHCIKCSLTINGHAAHR